MASVRQLLENEGRHSIASNSAPNKTLMVVVMPDLVPRERCGDSLLSSSESLRISENQNFGAIKTVTTVTSVTLTPIFCAAAVDCDQ